MLQAYKDDRKVDVLLDWTTPDDQRLELSQLVRQMITLNTSLAWLLASWLGHLQTRLMWYLTLREWGAMALAPPDQQPGSLPSQATDEERTSDHAD